MITRRAVLQALVAHTLLARATSAQTRVLGTPKPLPQGAVTHDWTSFLGPTHNARSTETRLSRTLPAPLLWEFTRGTGYTSPAIAGSRLVFVHRLGDEEVVECLHPGTGAAQWQFRYPTTFQDRYGYNNGPRSSPVINEDRVYTMGAEGQLHCLGLESGQQVWTRDLRTEYQVSQDFFGDGIDTARRRTGAHRQRRSPWRTVRRRTGSRDRTRSVARWDAVGPELRLARARCYPRRATGLCVRRR